MLRKRICRLVLGLILFSLPFLTKAQTSTADSLELSRYLLFNIATRIEVMQAVNQMYNFNFESADVTYRWFQLKHPEHPMPYFLRGLAEWVKIIPNPDDTQFDEKFLGLMDTTIQKAEKLYKQDKTNMEAVFFLAGAHGFKGRLLSDRKMWTKATFAGRKAMEYMQISRDNKAEELGVEFLFGEGLYNYFSVWIAENYKWLRPVMLFFPKGDKTKGLDQLEKVSRYAYYTRVEAQSYLLRIYGIESNKQNLNYELIKYLNTTYPKNPYFHRYMARIAHQQGRWREAEIYSQQIMSKVDSNVFGYGLECGRYASFFLGYINNVYHRDQSKAEYWYKRCLDYCERTDSKESGYYHYTLSALGKIYDQSKRKEEAILLFEKLAEVTERKSAYRKEAEKYLKENKPKKKFLGIF